MSGSEGAQPKWRERLLRLRQWIGLSARASPSDTRFSVPRQIAVILCAAAFMTVVGPFGTSGGSLEARLAYWIGLMTAGTLVANVLARLAVGMELFDRRPWLWAVVMASLMTPILTLVVWAVSGLLFGGGLDPTHIIYYGPPVLVVTLAMDALTVLSQRTPASTHAAAPGAPAPVFLERLPQRLRGGELYAVQAEDHYLRLHTSLGQDLILMRLSDALAELEGMEGAQVHRSWWVSKAAVAGVERGGGRASLTLKGGEVAPVSRTYARALRLAGWF